MKIVFYSNYMNHHQYFLCKELISLGAEFYFIQTTPVSEERKKLGYHTYDDEFIINYNDDAKQYVRELVMSADAVIFGLKPRDLFTERVNSGKLTFNFSERLFKRSILQSLLAPFNPRLKKNYLFNKDNIPYLLCSGGFVAGDYHRFGYPYEKCLKWGYFPAISFTEYEDIKDKKEKSLILWVARFIPLKHPEYMITLAKYLKARNLNFKIRMIGDGPLRETIENKILADGLGDYIEITGPMSPESVLEQYRLAGIATITSDRNEGWGAVVNEAMASGCAVVASDKMGSVPYLINDGVSGFTFDKVNELCKKVEFLLKNPTDAERISKNALLTINEKWNYKTAAKRLMTFIKDGTIYETGPISKSK